MKIGIDPGHGGFDPGAVGSTRLYEKDVTLAISMEIDKLLHAAGLETYMTRQNDETLELVTRSALLNNTKCDFAISVHINSAENKKANYISTFIQGTGGQAEQLAKKVQAELVQATGWPDGGVRVKNLHMTRETTMPAILVECGFISNPEQEEQLRQPETQKKIAGAIADGVMAYLGISKGESILSDKVPCKIIIKGQEFSGYIKGGVSYLQDAPIREVMEAMNNKIDWNEKTMTVTVK